MTDEPVPITRLVLPALAYERWRRECKDAAARGRRLPRLRSIGTACVLATRETVVLVTLERRQPPADPPDQQPRTAARLERQAYAVKRWNAGVSRARIACELGVSERAVANYITQARKAGIECRYVRARNRSASAA